MNENRVLFYSHDGYGMGNIRRTLAICQQLKNTIPNISILILTGSPVIHALRIPEGVDYVKLPCLSRDRQEVFRSKYWDMSIDEVIRFRSDLISSCVDKFDPDLFVVDKKPLGIKGELREAMAHIRERGRTKVVLGLRDVLDDPAITIPIWRKNRYYEAIRDYYDQVWIYGARNIFDAVKEYRMPDYVAEKVVFTGYLGRPTHALDRLAVRTELGLNGDLFTLVMVGGGEDGFPILRAYVEGMSAGHRMNHSRSLLVAGPDMPQIKQSEAASLCQKDPALDLLEFSDEIETFLNAADVVVSMGGYNTICEILSFQKKAVVVPRIHPVREQYIRARRLAKLGLINMIHPHDLSKETLFDAIKKTTEAPNQLSNLQDKIDLDGLSRITGLTKAFLPTVRVVNVNESYRIRRLEHRFEARNSISSTTAKEVIHVNQ